ncbi:MAG: hypothetical protein OXE02_12980 [Chloroflexi bacterium]|nr:hypothetical protein [Chloroflexota bacterium]
MAGRSNWQAFWAHHNAQHPSANVSPTHKDTNVYYHFRAPRLALGLFLNDNVEGKKGIGTYLRGFKREDKTVSRPRLAQHQQSLMGVLTQAAALNNDAPPRKHDDTYGDYSVFHEIDIDDPQNWAQMSKWFEDMRQVYIGVLGSPSPPQGSGLKQK